MAFFGSRALKRTGNETAETAVLLPDTTRSLHDDPALRQRLRIIAFYVRIDDPPGLFAAVHIVHRVARHGPIQLRETWLRSIKATHVSTSKLLSALINRSIDGPTSTPKALAPLLLPNSLHIDARNALFSRFCADSARPRPLRTRHFACTTASHHCFFQKKMRCARKNSGPFFLENSAFHVPCAGKNMPGGQKKGGPC